MRILIFVGWTAACVGVGIAMATLEVDGKTPWQHAQRAWKSDAEKKFVEARGSAVSLVDDVKRHVASAKEAAPLDRHSVEERDALEKLISNRQKK